MSELLSVQKTAILGFGNPVRSDDGIGVHVANRLMLELKDRNDISVFDMGTSAFEVLFKLKEHQRLIIIDAVRDSGEPDGTLFSLPASAIKAEIQDDPMVFLHGMKWDQALSYASKIMGDEFPEDNIQVYLVAISDFRMSLGMSVTLEKASEELVATIMSDLNRLL